MDVEPYSLIRIYKVSRVTFRFNETLKAFEFVPNCGLWRFDVHYRAVRRDARTHVEAKDELDAYIQALAHLKKLKSAYEKRVARK